MIQYLCDRCRKCIDNVHDVSKGGLSTIKPSSSAGYTFLFPIRIDGLSQFRWQDQHFCGTCIHELSDWLYRAAVDHTAVDDR